MRGGDEFGRSTLVIGWTITGKIVIALWRCRHDMRRAEYDQHLGMYCGKCGVDWATLLCTEAHDLKNPENNACNCYWL